VQRACGNRRGVCARVFSFVVKKSGGGEARTKRVLLGIREKKTKLAARVRAWVDVRTIHFVIIPRVYARARARDAQNAHIESP